MSVRTALVAPFFIPLSLANDNVGRKGRHYAALRGQSYCLLPLFPAPVPLSVGNVDVAPDDGLCDIT